MTDDNQAAALASASDAAPSDIKGLLGKKCCKVNFAYGGELCLHFGRQVSYEMPSMKGKKRGQWQLRTRGTAWQVFTSSEAFSSRRGSEITLLRKLKRLVGRKVVDISVSNANVLTIEFEGSVLFRVTPTRNDVKAQLPFWELAMPHHMTASFWHDSGWSFRASNVPNRE